MIYLFNSEHVQVLERLGFQMYDSTNEDHWHSGIEEESYELLFIEEHQCRHRIYVKLSDKDNDCTFVVYVLEDIGCGAIMMPFAWSELREDWLTHLKKSLYLHGFLKDGKEVTTN